MDDGGSEAAGVVVIVVFVVDDDDDSVERVRLWVFPAVVMTAAVDRAMPPLDSLVVVVLVVVVIIIVPPTVVDGKDPRRDIIIEEVAPPLLAVGNGRLGRVEVRLLGIIIMGVPMPVGVRSFGCGLC